MCFCVFVGWNYNWLFFWSEPNSRWLLQLIYLENNTMGKIWSVLKSVSKIVAGCQIEHLVWMLHTSQSCVSTMRNMLQWITLYYEPNKIQENVEHWLWNNTDSFKNCPHLDLDWKAIGVYAVVTKNNSK